MNNTSSLLSEGRTWFQRRALFFKVIGIAVLGMLLLLPLGMVKSTLRERQDRYREAVSAVTETWGGSQRVAGPVLVVPYTCKIDVEDARFADGQQVRAVRERKVTREAFFLPEQLNIEGQVDPSIRKRGIYATPVYSARLKVSGRFSAPKFDFITEREVQPLWDQARVSFMISDLRGTQENLVLKWGAESVALQPGASFDGAAAGVFAPVKLVAGGEGRDFGLELTLNGSDGLRFVPLGRQTGVRIVSSWADPSFGGAYLPVSREVGPAGFSAEWKIAYYGRNFSQEWTSGGKNHVPTVKEFEDSSFGLSLMQPVNAYRTVERAIKYGVLFITLVFTTFFLFEAVCGLRLNALNYLLVGGALCLFYLGTLALAEFMMFGVAYMLAAAASTMLIALYAWRILGNGRRAWLVGGMLGGVYGYLYFVLQMEDFALLAGTGALFVVLGAVMYATKKLDAGTTKAVEGREEA